MPQKTDEATRNRVVELLKAGQSYSQVQKATGLSKPVVWSIKKEAGLAMKPKNEPRQTQPSTAQSATGSTSTGGSGSPVVRPAKGDGVSEFQPVIKKVKATVVEPHERIHIQCEQCGVVLEGTPGDPLPDVCPECGH